MSSHWVDALPSLPLQTMQNFYGCVILEELDYLCNMCAVPAAQSGDWTAVRRTPKRFLFGGCLAFASLVPVVTFICTKTDEIDSQSLVLLTRTDFPEV